MQLSTDIFLYIGQNYLKNILCIKKIFYHYEDNDLQKLLFNEVLYKYKTFIKTTLPFNFIIPNKNNNAWIFHNIKQLDKLKKYKSYSNENYNSFVNDVYNRIREDEYQIYLTFEKEKHLLIKLEYICYNGYDNEIIEYSDTISNYTIDNENLKFYLPKIYKTLKNKIYHKVF